MLDTFPRLQSANDLPAGCAHNALDIVEQLILSQRLDQLRASLALRHAIE